MLTNNNLDRQRSSRLRIVPAFDVRSRHFGLHITLLLLLAFLIGGLAYQAPLHDRILIGWPADRLFLRASEGWSAADVLHFYGDELTPDAPTGRSRWTHQGAELRLPGSGQSDLTLALTIQGWPTDALNPMGQPQITLFANEQRLGDFRPTEHWSTQLFTIPSTIQARDELRLRLQASATFTGTQAYIHDLRPKGVRLAELRMESGQHQGLLLPPILPLGLFMLCSALCFLALSRLSYRPGLSFILTVLLFVVLGLGLVFVRIWIVALLPWFLLLLLLLWFWAERRIFLAYFARLYKRWARSPTPGYGLLVATIIASLAALLTAPRLDQNLLSTAFPDSLLFGLLALCVVGLIIVLGQRGLPRLVLQFSASLNDRLGLWLTLGFLVIWLVSLASINAILSYVGHADYADNAVVARNLLRGRGWVVDYVTQFYRLYDGITRPQETWPLLQPVWIVPFFKLFGISSWAAKIPNLIFTLLLGAMVYSFGARHWGRRVAFCAVLMLLTSHLFFKLGIYVTSDLAFVVFAFAALALLYQWYTGVRGQGSGVRGQSWQLIVSGLLTGLMIVQKPGSGGLIALGVGLWLLYQWLRSEVRSQRSEVATTPSKVGIKMYSILVWGALAALVVLPLIARNLSIFGKPYFSTESYDAWILEYTDWDRIYGVYAPELSNAGVPDRSWIMRWGFDRSLQKMTNQLKASRDYLLPAWPGLATGFSDVFARPDKDSRLLFDPGAWLTLLGTLTLIMRKSKLPGLLLAAFLPYALFLIIYWHVVGEERYFVVLMPWIALFAALALWRIYEHVAALAGGRWAPIGLLIVGFGLFWIMSPSWAKIAEKVYYEPQLYAADLDAYSWLKAHTPEDAVMMTRNPWQLNWSADRPALMIPYTTDREQLLWLARHYKVQYLVLDSLQRPEPEVRKMLDDLLADQSLGFKEVYRTPIYPATYGDKRSQVFAEIYAFP